MKTNIYRILTGLLFLNFSVAALAEDGGTVSEFQHMANDGAIEVTPMISYGSASVKLNGSSTLTPTASMMPVGVMGEYGINSMFSVGLDLSYLNTTIKPGGGASNETYKGLEAPVLFFNGRYATGPGLLRYGVKLTVSLAHETEDASGNTNGDVGADILTPWVGYEMALGGGIAGLQVSTDAWQSTQNIDVTDASGTKTTNTYTGGATTNVDLFYEMPTSDMVTVGAALKYAMMADQKNTTGGGSTALNEQNSTFDLNIYVPVKLSSCLLLPSFDYYSTSFSSSSFSEKSITGWDLNLAARFTF